jgi:hypothetical protein
MHKALLFFFFLYSPLILLSASPFKAQENDPMMEPNTESTLALTSEIDCERYATYHTLSNLRTLNPIAMAGKLSVSP